jgi:3-oxoacyl-[acyl-carrier-protein] synthase-1
MTRSPSPIAGHGLAALGLVNALGNGREQVLANLLAGSAPGLRPQPGWLPAGEAVVGTVEGELPAWPGHLAAWSSRNNRLLLAALGQIEAEVDDAIERFGRDRVAVVLGSSTSGIREGERALAAVRGGAEVPAGYHYRQQEIGAPAESLARLLGLDGLAVTLSTACSSSAKAFASARNLLDMDLCDAVLVGGVDSLCRLTLNGFGALDSLAAGRCRPFDAARDGINIGEAAALFLLTREPAPIRLLGVGEAADAHHISAPHPEGLGAEAAMRAALAEAGLSPGQIDYINLHGTATPQNDAMESRAVSRVCGETVPCTSTKALTGHTLGAAGATEVALCWLLLSELNRDRVLPAQAATEKVDEALAPINLLRQAAALPAGRPLRMLSNSFAFGGSNCAVIVEGQTWA